jgi:hypothetical protein
VSATRLIFALAAAVLLVACAAEPVPPRVYGPPTHHFGPGDMKGFTGMSDWNADGEDYHLSAPSFKGF